MKHIAVKGAQVPAVGLGTWRLSGKPCYEAVRSALDLGYRHIDTAEMYGNDQEVGRAIRECGIARERDLPHDEGAAGQAPRQRCQALGRGQPEAAWPSLCRSAAGALAFERGAARRDARRLRRAQGRRQDALHRRQQFQRAAAQRGDRAAWRRSPVQPGRVSPLSVAAARARGGAAPWHDADGLCADREGKRRGRRGAGDRSARNTARARRRSRCAGSSSRMASPPSRRPQAARISRPISTSSISR